MRSTPVMAGADQTFAVEANPQGRQEEDPVNHQQIRQPATPCKGTVSACTKCGQRTYVAPLHDERGGPLFCFLCAGAWHAEHAPKRRARRVLIKALKAYEKAGGSLHDKEFNELILAASGYFFVHEADRIGDDFADLTTELLNATIALVHPDKHPIERKAEATRVTQELHALKPFVFPAPEPEPPAKPDDALFSSQPEKLNKLSLPDYPCDDCRDALPMDYCDSCRAQHEKKWAEDEAREEKERLRKNARQRELYHQHNMFKTRKRCCMSCGEKFESKRDDAKYCSAACRQRAYVKRDGKASNNKPLRAADIKRALVILFTTNPDNAFTTDDLCERVYCLQWEQIERKHRAVVLPIAKDVCKQLKDMDWDWRQLHFSNGLVFWNRINLTSIALSHVQPCDHYDTYEKRKAAILRRSEFAEGG